MSRMSELAADAEYVAKFSEPLLEQAADRLSARYGTPKVVGFDVDWNSRLVAMVYDDGRWAIFHPMSQTEGYWVPMPRLVYADIKGIGPTPEEAEGAERAD